MVAEDLNIQL